MTITIKSPLKIVANEIAKRKLPVEIVEYRTFKDGTVVKCVTFPRTHKKFNL